MSLDRMMEAIRLVIHSMVGKRLAYLCQYPATVVQQDVDGTLHVQPDDPRVSFLPKLPGITGVPIRVGIPGTSVKVPQGTRVMLAFDHGSPAKPFATLFDSGTPAIEINIITPNTTTPKASVKVNGSGSGEVIVDVASGGTIKLGKSALQGIARLGDTVQAGPFGGVITGASTKVKSE